MVLPNHQHTLKMGTELVSETSVNLHILTLLSARENFIGFTDDVDYRVLSVNMKYGYSRTNIFALYIETCIYSFHLSELFLGLEECQIKVVENVIIRGCIKKFRD